MKREVLPSVLISSLLIASRLFLAPHLPGISGCPLTRPSSPLMGNGFFFCLIQPIAAHQKQIFFVVFNGFCPPHFFSKSHVHALDQYPFILHFQKQSEDFPAQRCTDIAQNFTAAAMKVICSDPPFEGILTDMLGCPQSCGCCLVTKATPAAFFLLVELQPQSLPMTYDHLNKTKQNNIGHFLLLCFQK